MLFCVHSNSVPLLTVYHIVPLQNGPCHNEPCLTLFHLAENFSNYLHSNSALIFLPGNHTLEKDITVANTTQILLRPSTNYSAKTLTRIICQQFGQLNFHNIERVYVLDVEFVGCSISFLSVHQVILEDSRLIGANNRTAAEFENSSVMVISCTFYSNLFGSYRDSYRVGGAIFSLDSNVTISRTFFYGNSAELGGAIYTEASNITIANSSFMENIASCSINKVDCSGTGTGGVFCSYFSTIVIYGNLFQSNSANSNQETGQGGVLAAFHGIVSINGSISMNNRAEGAGGVILAFRVTLTINQSEFYNNTAIRGGVLITEKSYINSVFTKFSLNSATFKGGVIHSIRSFIALSKSSFSENVAQNGGVMFVLDSEVNLTGCKAHNNSASGWFGGVVEIKGRTITLIESEFSNNTAEVSGGVAKVNAANISIKNSIFMKNTAKYYYGGVVHAVQANVTISGSNVTNSKAGKNGGVIQAEDSVITISGCKLIDNAGSHGGAVDFDNTIIQNYTLIIKDSEFSNNNATFDGGTVHGILLHSTLILIISSNFTNNSAGRWGGVIFSGGLVIDILKSNFLNNTAVQGGVLSANHASSIAINESRFIGNNAFIGGVLYTSERTLIHIHHVLIHHNTAKFAVIHMTESTAILSGQTSFSKNLGSLFAQDSSVNITGYTKFVDNLSPPVLDLQSGILTEGGAITVFQSDIHYSGSCFLMQNRASEGGAIFAFESGLFMHDKATVTITNNMATKNGGGIYLERTLLSCQSESVINVLGNSANDNGGGVYAIGSKFTVGYLCNSYPEPSNRSLVHFSQNSARKGGAIFLEMDAKLYIIKKCTFKSFMHHSTYILFTNNSADYGGAIFAADNTNSGICASSPLYKILSTTTECFLQVIQPNLVNIIEYHRSEYYQNIHFSENHASIQGENLYGGLLDRCTTSIFSPLNNLRMKKYIPNFINGTTLFKTVTGLVELDSVSSDPLRVCFCHKGKPDCQYQPPPVRVKKGEIFVVSLVAVDQTEHSVSATIRSLLKSNVSSIGQCQLVQDATVGCTELRFNVYSPNDFEELILYADGPCKDAKFSRAKVLIKFQQCTCPVGFQVMLGDTTRCTCECDSKIDKYITDCDPQKHTFLRKSNFWITNYSTNYLIYPHCPFDYCSSPSSNVAINLNIPNGSDAQCAFNRSGKLCGKCKPGLSLSLSSSRCLVCSWYWPALLVAILLAGVLAGIALVVLILVLNMTVAIGTLNGIIFYANIINAYNTLPIESPYIIRLFISWLNLHLGFDVCLFDGMTGFWKTIIQLAFPTYLILLVIVVIFFSERSTRFAQLIGKKNPVATLATIVLLSYAKLLRVAITSLSFTILVYPDGSRELVWLPDATVSYIRGKHAVLFVIAILILVIGIAYTAVLFSWQWLLQHQNKIFLKWVRHQRLCMFLEPYHAPYTFKHRYWTGLLLLVRAVLYIISAANVSNDPGIELIAVGIAMTGLLLLKGYSQGARLYRKAFIDLLEMICYVNILLSCLAVFFVLNGHRDTDIIAYISGSVTFVLLMFVLAYHVFTEFYSKCKCTQISPSTVRRYVGDQDEMLIKETNLNKPTHSEVDGPIENPQILPQMLTRPRKSTHPADQSLIHFVKMSDRELECSANQGDTSNCYSCDSNTTASYHLL